MKGQLIVFEGPDGSGKTTQARMAYERMKGELGESQVSLYRDPGDTRAGEEIRKLLLGDLPLCPKAQLLLFAASRTQLCAEKVRPDLEAGRVVLLDRYWLSTAVYQFIAPTAAETTRPSESLASIAVARMVAIGSSYRWPAPDYWAVFSADDVTLGLRRAAAGKQHDRFEKNAGYAAEVRRGYEAGVRAMRCCGIGVADFPTAAKTPEEVHAAVWAELGAVVEARKAA